MYPVLLFDFGSTYTKVTAVDVDAPAILQTAQSFTTVETDIGAGLDLALSRMGAHPDDFREMYACSSAAGGLRMVVSGLMPELTSKAAHMAALGAGAKVVRSFSHELTAADLQEIMVLQPDIFLLCGGTDGGNRRCIEENAKALAGMDFDFPVIYAGNRSARDVCSGFLREKTVHYCENVLPTLDTIRIDEVQAVIREIFQQRIVQGKGLSRINELLDRIAMPTPFAVQKALELLAKGTGSVPGLGELAGIDIGGATTDVYSMADGLPEHTSVLTKSLPEPWSKRTVEGDIGMRYSLDGVVEEAGYRQLAEFSGLPVEKVTAMLRSLQEEKSLLPADRDWKALDFALAKTAVTTAMHRHAGCLEEVYTPQGKQYIQTGKDLRSVTHLVLTGGALLHTDHVHRMVSGCLYSERNPHRLLPREVTVHLDQKYILSAIGVLSEHYPDAALTILKKELSNAGNTKS